MTDGIPRPVRHCPNADCPALVDTGAVSEYGGDSIACADCGATLVEGPAPAVSRREPGAPEPYAGTLVTLLVSRGDRLTFVRDGLEQAGIPSFVQGQQASRMFGGVTTTRLLVREEDAARARELLETIVDESGLEPDDVEPVEASDPDRPRMTTTKWLALIGFAMLALKLLSAALRG